MIQYAVVGIALYEALQALLESDSAEKAIPREKVFDVSVRLTRQSNISNAKRQITGRINTLLAKHGKTKFTDKATASPENTHPLFGRLCYEGCTIMYVLAKSRQEWLITLLYSYYMQKYLCRSPRATVGIGDTDKSPDKGYYYLYMVM